MKGLLVPLLAAALWGAALAAEAQGPSLGLQEAFKGQDSSNQTAIFAVSLALAGEPLQSQPAVPTFADCATTCRLNGECAAFLYCGALYGCALPGNVSLKFQECQLQAVANCTLAPTVLARGVGSLLVSGFPVRNSPPPALPGLVASRAVGLEGGDFECPDLGSVVSGACAFRDILSASFTCSSLLVGQCASVAVYANGTEGCGGSTLAVLKTVQPMQSNAFWAPTMYTFQMRDEDGGLIMYDETTVTAPDNDTQLAVAPGTAPGGNSSAPYLGCVLVDMPAVMDGDINRTIDGVASAEACCRECRSAGPRACNTFNWCPANTTCRFQDKSVVLTLQPEQCELRFQAATYPSMGLPPYLLAKGELVSGFRAGAPVAVGGPELTGYRRSIAGGLYGQPGTPCADRIKPKTNECILSAPLPQLADRCSADPLCAAFIWKPAGTFSTNATNVGTLRQAQGANATRMVSNPTAVVYFKEQASSTSPQPSSGSSGGLSSGAIAGIAAGCAVTAAAAGGWALLLWRRRQRAAHVAAVAPAGSDKALEDGKCSGLAPPFLALACKGAGQAEGSSHRGVLGEAPAAQAATCKDPTGGHGQDSSSSGGTKNGGVGSAAASPVPLKAAIIGWRTAASPFAAARGRMGPSPSAASPGGSGSGPAGCTGPAASGGRLTPISPLDSSGEHMLSNSGTSGEDAAPVEEPEQQVELSRVIKELIQHREAEEAAACLPTGATQPAGGAGSGSGGGGFGSGGSGGSGFGAAPSHLGPAALPPSLQAWLIPPGELKYLERRNGELAVLGEGASGRVIRAELRGEVVAAKEVELVRGLEQQEAFIKEAQQLCNLRHPNIVTFYGCCVRKGKGILLTELCEGCDLGSALRLTGGDGQRAFGWYKHGCRVAYEVSRAINYLHSRGVVHMDIKSANVLLTSRGGAKLCDVGLARMQTRTVMSDLPHVVGTFAWAAPEVLMGGRNCTSAVDLYSFGVLLWEIFTGLRPVRAHMPSPSVPGDCTQEAADLMAACCSLDPAARPSAEAVMKRLHAMLAAQHRGRPLDFS